MGGEQESGKREEGTFWIFCIFIGRGLEDLKIMREGALQKAVIPLFNFSIVS